MADTEQITHPKQVRCPDCNALPGDRCSTRDAKRRIVWLRTYHRGRWAKVNQATRRAS